MAVENLVDGFYALYVSEAGTDFTKVSHLQKATPPSDEKVLDDVTATDDKRTVKAVVDFKENGEIEFEYVLDPQDAGQKLIQKAFDGNKELTFAIKYVNLPAESKKFKGLVGELTTDNDDPKKKLRKKGKITITSDTQDASTINIVG